MVIPPGCAIYRIMSTSVVGTFLGLIIFGYVTKERKLHVKCNHSNTIASASGTSPALGMAQIKNIHNLCFLTLSIYVLNPNP